MLTFCKASLEIDMLYHLISFRSTVRAEELQSVFANATWRCQDENDLKITWNSGSCGDKAGG